MAKHPCGGVPPVARLVDPEEVDVPVQIGLHVRRRHAGEPPEVALEPGAHAVGHLHRLEVGGVAAVGLVGLGDAAAAGDDPVVGALAVVDDDAAGREVARQGLPHPRRAGLAVPADLGNRVLVHVDGGADAELLAGEPALARLAVALGEVRVVDVGLVYPDAVAQHDAPLVARHRGEHAVAPLEGRLVAHAAQLGGAVQRHVVPHQADEAGPRRQGGLRPLEDGAGQRCEPRPAARAAPPPDAGRLAAVPPRSPPAPGARRVGPEELGGLGEGAETQLVAAEPLVERGGQKGEPVGVQGRHEAGVGVLPLHISLSHPPRRPPSGVVAKR